MTLRSVLVCFAVLCFTAPLAAEAASSEDGVKGPNFARMSRSSFDIYLGFSSVEQDVDEIELSGVTVPGGDLSIVMDNPLLGIEYHNWNRGSWVWRIGLEVGTSKLTVKDSTGEDESDAGTGGTLFGSVGYDILISDFKANAYNFGMVAALDLNSRVAETSFEEVLRGTVDQELSDVSFRARGDFYLEYYTKTSMFRGTAGLTLELPLLQEYTESADGAPDLTATLESNVFGVRGGIEYYWSKYRIILNAVVASETSVRAGFGWVW